jgi:hypothetical protein
MPNIADDLVAVVDEAAARYLTFTDAHASVRHATDGWSPKEVIGHLIDSAANNTQRFVRAQESGALVFPGYAQDHWVRTQGYQSADWKNLVAFWQMFNHHVGRVMRCIPPESLAIPCSIGDGAPVTLGFLVEDYFAHLRHHLEQIDARLVRS